MQHCGCWVIYYLYCTYVHTYIIHTYITTRYQYSTAGKLPSLSLSLSLSSPLSVGLFVQLKWTEVSLTLALLGCMPWMCQPASASKQPRWRVWSGLLGRQPFALQQASVLLMTYCRAKKLYTFCHPKVRMWAGWMGPVEGLYYRYVPMWHKIYLCGTIALWGPATASVICYEALLHHGSFLKSWDLFQTEALVTVRMSLKDLSLTCTSSRRSHYVCVATTLVLYTCFSDTELRLCTLTPEEILWKGEIIQHGQ